MIDIEQNLKHELLGLVIRMGSLLKQPSRDEHVRPDSYKARYTLEEVAYMEKNDMITRTRAIDLKLHAALHNKRISDELKHSRYATLGMMQFLHRLADNANNKCAAQMFHDTVIRVRDQQRSNAARCAVASSKARARGDAIFAKALGPEVLEAQSSLGGSTVHAPPSVAKSPRPDMCISCEYKQANMILFPCRHCYHCEYCYKETSIKCLTCGAFIMIAASKDSIT